MKWEELKRFKPTFIFLVAFLGFYLAGNLLYGFWIESYRPIPDPATRLVTDQVSFFLREFGFQTTVEDSQRKATVILLNNDLPILGVFEGCNGLNVMIVYIAFLIGMGPMGWGKVFFLVIGSMVIHFLNLARIGGLFWVVLNRPESFYMVHKYFFTAVLYAAVFFMWLLWLVYMLRMRKYAS